MVWQGNFQAKEKKREKLKETDCYIQIEEGSSFENVFVCDISRRGRRQDNSTSVPFPPALMEKEKIQGLLH